jgi:MATE family multidrug resistance protein
MPALLFYGLNDLQRKLLNSFMHNTVPLASFLIAITMHPVWCWVLAIKYDMKLEGIALAAIISNFFNFVLMTVFFWSLDDMQEAFVLPNQDAIDSLKEYMEVSVPNVIMCCLDYWAYEMMTIVSGTIGVEQQAGQVILMNMSEMSFMIGMGLQSAACTVQGNKIG